MNLCIQPMIPHRGGLPHSDTWGSTPARGSPQIFAACHVLHRLLAPRHPPDALLLLIPARTHRRAPAQKNPAMHRNHPPPKTPAADAPSHNRALTQHTLYALNAATGLASKPRPLAQPQTPGQTPRPNPSRTPRHAPPNRSRSPAKPTETSRASKTHQNLIHNPQRTHTLQAPSAKPRQPAVIQPLKPEPWLSMTPQPQQTSSAQTPKGQTPKGQAPGGGRDRTDDLLLAKQALSQLSYAPIPAPAGTRPRCAEPWWARPWWARPWWAREDSNLRPHAYQACALTN